MEQTHEENSVSSRVTNYKTWAERNGFSDWATALIWLFLCLTVFQLLAMLVAGVGYFLVEYIFNYPTLMQIVHNLKQGGTGFMRDHLSFLFIINSTWQILFLGLGTYFFVRICSGRNHRKSYLRLKQGGSLFTFLGTAVLLIVAAQPLIWFLGWMNSFIPVPEFFKNLQQSQLDLIGSFLKNNNNIFFALFNVALVPAVCEEVLFRGFVFRSFEKGWGVKVSIILSGLLFGLYHIQLSNLLPLACIGMLLAFIAWTADSIYPAMVAHFINNGASVLIAVYYPGSAMAESAPQNMPPFWLIIVSGVITAYLIYLLINNQTKEQITSQGAAYDE